MTRVGCRSSVRQIIASSRISRGLTLLWCSFFDAFNVFFSLSLLLNSTCDSLECYAARIFESFVTFRRWWEDLSLSLSVMKEIMKRCRNVWVVNARRRHLVMPISFCFFSVFVLDGFVFEWMPLQASFAMKEGIKSNQMLIESCEVREKIWEISIRGEKKIKKIYFHIFYYACDNNYLYRIRMTTSRIISWFPPSPCLLYKATT